VVAYTWRYSSGQLICNSGQTEIKVGINCLLEYLQLYRLPPLSLYFTFTLYMIPIACKITKYFCLLFWDILLLMILHSKKDGECVPQCLIIGNPISQYTLYAAMFCLLHCSVSIEQHKKHLCNPFSHYRKYGRFTCDVCAPYLNAWKP